MVKKREKSPFPRNQPPTRHRAQKIYLPQMFDITERMEGKTGRGPRRDYILIVFYFIVGPCRKSKNLLQPKIQIIISSHSLVVIVIFIDFFLYFRRICIDYL